MIKNIATVDTVTQFDTFFVKAADDIKQISPENTGLLAASDFTGVKIPGRNLIKGASQFRSGTPFTVSAAKDNDFKLMDGVTVELEAGKAYTFSIKTDGTWGGTSGTDTVEVYLLKDAAYTVAQKMSDAVATFTARATGVYSIRCDSNKSGCTHTFWDVKIEEGTLASEWCASVEDAPETVPDMLLKVTNYITAMQAEIDAVKAALVSATSEEGV